MALEDIGYRGNLQKFFALVQKDQLQSGEQVPQSELTHRFVSMVSIIRLINEVGDKVYEQTKGQYPLYSPGTNPGSKD